MTSKQYFPPSSGVTSKRREWMDSRKGRKGEKSVKATTGKREKKRTFQEGADTKGIKRVFEVLQYCTPKSYNDFVFLAYVYFKGEKRGSTACI